MPAGTIVTSGSLVSPGGQQGIPGPNAVSTDAGNIATWGTDGKLYVSDPTPKIWSSRLRSFNAVGNPSFEVDQRNVGVFRTSPPSSQFVIDRWYYGGVGSWNANVGQMSAALPDICIPGTSYRISQYYLRFQLTAQDVSLAAGDYCAFWQQVEGPNWRELSNDVHSLQVLVRSSVAGIKFGLALQDTGATRYLTKLATIPTANIWTLLTFSNLPIFPSGPFSASPGQSAYTVTITLAAGSTFMGTANDTWQSGNKFGAIGQSNFLGQAINSTFDIAFCQHEPGSQCTTLQDCPFGENLDGPMGCQRYFCKSYDYAVKPGGAGGGTVMLVQYTPNDQTLFRNWIPFPKPMAKSPTVTIYNGATGAINSVQDFGGVNLGISVVYSAEKGITAIKVTPASSYGGIYPSYTADTGW